MASVLLALAAALAALGVGIGVGIGIGYGVWGSRTEPDPVLRTLAYYTFTATRGPAPMTMAASGTSADGKWLLVDLTVPQVSLAALVTTRVEDLKQEGFLAYSTAATDNLLKFLVSACALPPSLGALPPTPHTHLSSSRAHAPQVQCFDLYGEECNPDTYANPNAEPKMSMTRLASLSAMVLDPDGTTRLYPYSLLTVVSPAPKIFTFKLRVPLDGLNIQSPYAGGHETFDKEDPHYHTQVAPDGKTELSVLDVGQELSSSNFVIELYCAGY